MISWISGSDDLHRSLDPLVSPGFLTLAVFLRYPFKWVLLATLEQLAMPATALRLKGTRDMVCFA